NCVAHNGSLVPVPGRDIMVQGWYQGGISVFDWTDPAHPKEIAYFDRGPMDSTKLVGAGSWSAYWYNGYIVSSEIGRGLDVLELLPSGWLSQNEIDAAKLVHFDYLNVQDQPKLVWPPSFAVGGGHGRRSGAVAAGCRDRPGHGGGRALHDRHDRPPRAGGPDRGLGALTRCERGGARLVRADRRGPT